MKKTILLILLFFVFDFGFCQFQVETVFETNEYNKGVYRFPVFINECNQIAASKINTYLQLTSLNLIIGKEDSIIFENDWPTKEDFSGKTYLDFKIVTNNQHILSVKFSSECCAAYCEGYETYFNFNSKTGDLIILEELFTKDGYELFTDIVSLHRKVILLEAIINCDNYFHNMFEGVRERTNVDIDQILSNNSENDAEKKIYTTCLKSIDTYSFGSEFLIGEEQLYSFRNRCSNHGNRGLDAVGDFKNSISFQRIKPLFSSYGENILFDTLQVYYELSEIGKVFNGLIGKTNKVTFMITGVNNDSVEAIYCYNQFGKGIVLNGRRDGDKLILFGRNGDWKKTEEFQITFSSDKREIEGFWCDLENNKKLPIILSRSE